jgi:hypothetical protein
VFEVWDRGRIGLWPLIEDVSGGGGGGVGAGAIAGSREVDEARWRADCISASASVPPRFVTLVNLGGYAFCIFCVCGGGMKTVSVRALSRCGLGLGL